jgi:dihydroceramide fatty acyl 2-hydroxylase
MSAMSLRIDQSLSAAGYMADFWVVPLAVAACIALAFLYGTPDLWWPAVFIGGIAAWLVFEYALHRWFLHGPYRKQHWLHHVRPASYISVSTSFTFAAFFLTWAVFSSALPFAIGQVFFAGFYAAYFGYRLTHHALHQWSDERLKASKWFRPLHDAHEIHHTGKPCNFGVQTLVFDRLFGTYRQA